MPDGKLRDIYILKKLIPFVIPHRKFIFLSILLIPLMVGFELIQPLLIKIAIDNYIGQKSLEGLHWIVLLFFAAIILQALIGFFQIYTVQIFGQLTIRDIRITSYKHILKQRRAFFDRTSIGQLFTRITSDVDAISELFSTDVVRILSDAFKLIGIIIILFYFNAKMALMILIITPLLIFIVEKTRRSMRRSYRRIQAALSRVNTYASEHIDGIKVVQMLTRTQETCDNFTFLSNKFKKANYNAIRSDVTLYAIIEAISVITVAIIVWQSEQSMGDSVITIGLVVAFIEYTNKFFIPVRNLSHQYTIMQAALTAIERVVALLSKHEEDAPITHTSKKPHTQAYIEFQNISFAYDNKNFILNDISFSVAQGETIAILGATGCGKSTMIKLLARLYEPQQGSIFINQTPLVSMPSNEVRQYVTIVPQDTFLFRGTLRENIRFEDETISDEQIHSVLNYIGADLFKTNRSLDTVVNEHGNNFSLGEKQLISFARALIRNPQTLILDEATASVDPDTEKTIEQSLHKMIKGKTNIIIAHRLSTIKRASRILVIDQGQIKEEGTHDELLAKQALYASLVTNTLR